MTLTKILNKLKPHPKKRYIYAVTGGKYLGELLVYIDKKDDTFSFLSLPSMKNRVIPKVNFNFGLTEKIVEEVNKIPLKVYYVCKAQHKKNVEDNNIAV